VESIGPKNEIVLFPTQEIVIGKAPVNGLPSNFIRRNINCVPIAIDANFDHDFFFTKQYGL